MDKERSRRDQVIDNLSIEVSEITEELKCWIYEMTDRIAELESLKVSLEYLLTNSYDANKYYIEHKHSYCLRCGDKFKLKDITIQEK